MRPALLLELQKNDAAVNAGHALSEITAIIHKMYSEGGLDTANVRKILNDGTIIEQFASCSLNSLIFLSNYCCSPYYFSSSFL